MPTFKLVQKRIEYAHSKDAGTEPLLVNIAHITEATEYIYEDGEAKTIISLTNGHKYHIWGSMSHNFGEWTAAPSSPDSE